MTPTPIPSAPPVGASDAYTPIDLMDLTIEAERLPNWTRAGVDGGIPDTSDASRWPVLSALSYGANAACNGADDRAAIQSAINAASGQYGDGRAGTVVYLPPGCYEISSGLNLASNVVLKGAGQSATTISYIGGSSPQTMLSASGGEAGVCHQIYGNSGAPGRTYSLSNHTGVFNLYVTLLGYRDASSPPIPAAGYLGISNGAAGSVNDMEAIVSFSTDSALQVFDGATGSYRADANMVFRDRTDFDIRFEVDIPNQRYSVFVDGEPLATNYRLRQKSGAVNVLNSSSIIVNTRYARACDLSDVSVVAGYLRGSSQLTFNANPGLAAGDYFVIREDHDPSKFDAFLASRPYIRQVLRAQAVSGNVVQLDRALQLDFYLSPRIRKMSPIRNAGFESFKVMYPTSISGGYADQMRIQSAVNTFVRDVHFYWGDNGHLALAASRDVTVEGCTFERLDFTEPASAGGEGGSFNSRAIGVVEGTTDSLVINNIFRHVEATVKYEYVPVQNVWAYNYSSNLLVNKRDMWLHGIYPSATLFEGNTVADGRGEADNFWGKQGPYNTWFRNRAIGSSNGMAGFTTHVDNNQFSVGSFHNYIANVADSFYGAPGCSNAEQCVRTFDSNRLFLHAEKNRYTRILVDYNRQGTTTYVPEIGVCLTNPQVCHGFVGPKVKTCNGPCETLTGFDGREPPAAWDSVRIPASLFLTERPSFWCQDLPWPAIGADVDNVDALNMLPAERRARGIPCVTN